MTRTKQWFVPALVLAAGIGVAVVLATIGSALQTKLCFGGGSECKGVQPISGTAGALFTLAGNVVLVASPFIAALVAWRRS